MNCGFPDFISTATILSIVSSQYQHYLIFQEITVHPACSGFQAVVLYNRGFEITCKNFKDFLLQGNLNFFPQQRQLPLVVFFLL